MKTKTKKQPAALEAAVKATKTVATKEKTKKVSKEVAAAVTGEKVISKRETNYKFPEDCTSLKDKKAFRGSVRRKNKAFLAKMAKLQASTLPEDQEMLARVYAEYEAFNNEVKIGEVTPLEPKAEKPVTKKKTKAKAKATE